MGNQINQDRGIHRMHNDQDKGQECKLDIRIKIKEKGVRRCSWERIDKEQSGQLDNQWEEGTRPDNRITKERDKGVGSQLGNQDRMDQSSKLGKSKLQ
jgi:hypothetical protein